MVLARVILCALGAAALQLPARSAHAEDLPAFRAGMWEFVRNVEGGPGGKPQILTATRCTNPGEDMKRQHEKLGQLGCKFSPATRGRNVYTFAAQCSMPGKTQGESKSVITVESHRAYSLRVETRHGPQSTVETLKARRTGDCSK